MTSRSCWTCKDHKISCDRTVPYCLKCAKAKRQCRGYEMRLSWPRRSDRKRAMVMAINSPAVGGRTISSYRDPYFINATAGDIWLHGVASDAFGHVNITTHRTESLQSGPPNVFQPPSWTSTEFDTRSKDLLHYFETEVINALPVFDSDRNTISRILMDLALSDDRPASKAVLLSMLALATSYWSRDWAQAGELKLSAVQALMASSQKGVGGKDAVRHIAAGILLSAFEMHVAPKGCSEWIGHICGTRDVIEAVQREGYAPGSDASVILGWAFYHDILAQFVIRHWRTHAVRLVASDLGFNPHGKVGCAFQYLIARELYSRQIPAICSHAHPLLSLLNEVFHTTLNSDGVQYHDEEYQRNLQDLEARLESVQLIHLAAEPPHKQANRDTSQSLELFRLAGLVYLERASKNFSGSSTKLELWTDKAFSILRELRMCQHLLPLFIFACEGRDDDRRRVILELMARREQTPHLRNLPAARALIHTAWIHEDLETEREVNYLRKVDLVLSSSEEIPHLA